MDPLEIRIGNDIRLQITLNRKDNYEPVNIKDVRVYLINTELPKEQKCCKNDYYLHACGCPAYHVIPSNDRCDVYEKCGRYYVKPMFPTLPSCKQAPMPKPRECFDFVAPQYPDDMKYLCPVKLSPKDNEILAYFPAFDQRLCGVYKLVVVTSVYEPGWGRTNVRTFTTDYGDVFKLVEEGNAGGEITVDVNTVAKYDYIGYLPTRPFSKEDESDENKNFERGDDNYETPDQEFYTSIGADNVDFSKLTKVEDLTQPIKVTNKVDGQYLWIVTRKEIEAVYNLSQISSGTTPMVVPITAKQTSSKNSLNYYSTSQPLYADNGTIFCVKFKQEEG